MVKMVKRVPYLYRSVTHLKGAAKRTEGIIRTYVHRKFSERRVPSNRTWHRNNPWLAFEGPNLPLDTSQSLMRSLSNTVFSMEDSKINKSGSRI